jgi:DNA primase
MGIVGEDIERTRSATDIVALVSEKVALRRVGRRWVGLCPFHSEKTPSFSVNAELGRYYCFGCQASGDAISFVRETEHLDFPGAVEALAARAGVPLRYEGAEHEPGAPRRRTKALAEAMERAVTWYHERLLSSADAAPARQYLRSRGYDGETVRHFRLGWAPEGYDGFARESELPTDLLIEAGLVFRNQGGGLTDSFRARVLFPIFDVAGRPVGFGGRVLPGRDGPKYKNTPKTPLYDKSRVLYGLNWAKSAIVERGQVVVCEGYTDVIGLHLCGVTEAVATCGTALAEGHVKLLTGFSRRILLAYDADSAGQGAAARFYDWERSFEADIRVVELPPGADPADLARADPGRLRQAVAGAQPYLGFRLERTLASADLASPEGRARAAEAAVAIVAEHPDPLVRDQYVMEVSDRCRVPAERLRELMRRGGPKPGFSPRLGAGGRLGGTGGAERAAPGSGPRAAAPVPPRPPAVPPPELEALRLAIHEPRAVAGRLDAVLFASELGSLAYRQLASAMTLHGAIESAPPEVADLLSQLAVAEPEEDPDDVLRRLLDRAASRGLAELTREARTGARADVGSIARRTAELQLALQQLRSVEPGPGYEGRLGAAERQLLTLLLGSGSEDVPGTN